MHFIFFITLFFVSFFCFEQKANQDWQDLARQDLQAVHQLLSENHPAILNPEDQEFNNWLDKGYQKASSRINEVNCESAYQALLQFYAAGFDDTHLRIHFEPDADKNYLPQKPTVAKINWAGFHIKYENNQYVVSNVSEDSAFAEHLPPEGAKLLFCDDLTPKEYLIQNISP